MKTNVSINEVKTFWNANPCGRKFVPEDAGSAAFFKEIERHRYALEPHILDVVPFSELRGKDVLEVGCGLGTDALQFARAGARYHGIDLTETAVEMTRNRFALEGLPADLQTANVESLPFPDDHFDFVYSHGVIHHTPDIEKAVAEIYRVLKPGGVATVMVYHRRSFNYLINISLLRRLGAWVLLLPGGVHLVRLMTGEKRELLESHRRKLKGAGVSYLSSKRFLSENTDGPGNPLSRVYGASELKRLFGRFAVKRTCVRYFNVHRLPVLRSFMPKWIETWIGNRFGWHLYIFATK